MKNQIYENCYSQELENLIASSPVLPLINELFYKYGLKVFQATSIKDFYKHEYRTRIEETPLHDTGFYMTLDGLPYCLAYVESNDDGELTYCFKTMNYIKERGRDDDDKRTLRSKKISSLIKSIDTKKGITPLEDFLGVDECQELRRTLENTIRGDSYKRNNLDSDLIHNVLKAFMSKMSLDKFTREQISEIQNTLDDMDKVDNINLEKREKVLSFMNREIFMLGKSFLDGFVVSKVKINYNDDLTFNSLDIIEPFQRVLDINTYTHKDEILPILTMWKLYSSDKEDIQRYKLEYNNIKDDYFVRTSHYCEDLDIATIQTYTPTTFRATWIAIPINERN